MPNSMNSLKLMRNEIIYRRIFKYVKYILLVIIGSFFYFSYGYVINVQKSGSCPRTNQKPFDYSQALCMVIMFYEAQRAGKLPKENRFPWRKDSALDDGFEAGVDLEGGYYDAGDFVKFGLPISFTVTLLSWGLISYPVGYEESGQTSYARDAIRWGAEYFIKAKTGKTEFWGQVGDGDIDHTYWGRPEEMNMKRPSFQINETHPGSDLAGETAAALAAASKVFEFVDPDFSVKCLQAAKELFEFAHQYRGLYSDAIPVVKGSDLAGETAAALAAASKVFEFVDPDFSVKCLQAAKELFEFAHQYRGLYSDAIPVVKGFYTSSSYKDELAWAALWLYKASLDSDYLRKANLYVDEFDLLNEDPSWGYNFDWNIKNAGIFALGAELDKSKKYTKALTKYIDYIISEQTRTPKGLVFIDDWGSLRHTANVVFIALRAASLGYKTKKYHAFAKEQINYMLGSTGRSFVCGFGVNPPSRVHHRASSCPDLPASCGWKTYYSPDSNSQVLYGALVGGPDVNDDYVDNRADFKHNEVACDFNAAFAGCLAAIVEQVPY